VDGSQAMLPYFLEDIQIEREAYLKRVELRQRQSNFRVATKQTMGASILLLCWNKTIVMLTPLTS